MIEIIGASVMVGVFIGMIGKVNDDGFLQYFAMSTVLTMLVLGVISLSISGIINMIQALT
ncbi:hypothetical protein [Priestia megaterium]|uniref:hypothetical protein n=1 Tax=Priestia megaterium TaxID=1404 RepID=UPI00196B2529|nr:hypothetical protein [Priestia megaterium]QSF38457.1 hypothetical protein ICR96_23925 [Priestia megaterium]